MTYSSPFNTRMNPTETISNVLRILRQVVEITNRDVLGVVVIIGIFGNILSIVIFLRCQKKDHVTVAYLTPLAVADLGTLLYGLFSWVVSGVLEKANGYFFLSPPLSTGPQILCKLIRYLYRVFSCTSSYILVLFTFERCFAVWRPLKVHVYVTNRHRVTAIKGTILASFLVNVPILVYYRVYFRSQTGNTGCYFDATLFRRVDTYFYTQLFCDKIIPHAIPCIFIIVFSVLIVVGVRKGRMEAKITVGQRRNENSKDLSLLLVGLLYLVSTLPYIIIWTVFDLTEYEIGGLHQLNPFEVFILYNAAFFSTSFSMLNYSFNFLIYSFTLDIYQEQLVKMINAIKRALRF